MNETPRPTHYGDRRNVGKYGESKSSTLWDLKNEPRNIYVAASMYSQTAALKMSYRLLQMGFNPTSSWVSADMSVKPKEEDKYEEYYDWNRERGGTDYNDCLAADTLVVLADRVSSSGGYHVEFGLFLGNKEKQNNVLVVSDRKNVFYYMDCVRYASDEAAAIDFLKTQKERWNGTRK